MSGADACIGMGLGEGIRRFKTGKAFPKNRAAHGMINPQYTALSAKTYRPRTYAANDNQVCPYPARCISDPVDDVA
jgi:hypothetical protein